MHQCTHIYCNIFKKRSTESFNKVYKYKKIIINSFIIHDPKFIAVQSVTTEILKG